MNKFAFACKATLVAASLATAFGTAYAEREPDSVMLAQAQAEPGAYGSAGSSGASGTSGAGMSSEQPGQTGGASSSGAAASGTSPSQDPDPAAAGTSGASGTAGAAGKQAAGTHPPVFLVMPVDVAANDSAMKQGCWARVYDRENYSGDMLTLFGPASFADLSGPFGLNWDDRVNSIEVGPRAMVTVYDDPGFSERVAQFKPGQRVADLSKRMGFFDEFASVRIECQQR